MLRDVVFELDRWTAEGRRAAIATVVQVHGSAPSPVGTLMAVRDDGLTAGAVSGGCVETRVVDAAVAVAAGADPRRLRFAPHADPLLDTGLPCGGGIDVLVEAWAPSAAQRAFAAAVLRGDAAELRSEAAGHAAVVLCAAEPQRRLVLVGAGLLADAVARLASPLGWSTTILDPREAFAARGSSAVVARWPARALAADAVPLGRRDALLALSHHPALDDEALAWAVASEVGFIGALGSRRSHAERLARLRERGSSDAALARIVGPVGLDLGGWSPAETAVSIVGELLAARHGRSGGRLMAGDGAIHGPSAASASGVQPPVEPVRAVGRR